MNDEQILSLIARAIQNANIDYPNAGGGVTRLQAVGSNEDSGHLAKAVLKALNANNLHIVKSS